MARDGGDELVERLLENLDGLARITTRRMFGGVGLYSGGRLFGVVHRAVLYLRADDNMRRDLARRGAGPFRPYRGRVVTTFWEIPPTLAGEKRRIRAMARRAMTASDDPARRTLGARPSLTRRLVRVKLAPPGARRPPGRRS
jgi:DNA transformation protein